MTLWTIAILTVKVRKPFFRRLMDCLEPQIGDRDIEVLIADQEEWSVSRKRQWCLDNAKGVYFNFADDDDLVAKNYVDSIYPLLDGTDYVGFKLQYYHNGTPWMPTHHSLKYETYSYDDKGHYRGVSHLNPIRTEIARQGWFEGGYGEDVRWADRVKPQTEHFIDDIMYYYYFSTATSLTAER